jgi:hypothetical protein
LGKATGDIDLDIDEMGVQTNKCRAPHLGKHETTAFLFWVAAKSSNYRKSLRRVSIE